MKYFTLSCLWVSILAAVSSAQTPAAPTAYAESRDGMRSNGTATTFNFDFPGGSLGQLLEQLAEVGKDRMNIIVAAGASDIEEPKMTLRGVHTLDVLFALDQMSKANKALGVWKSSGPVSNAIWSVSASVAPKKTTVFYIGDLLRRNSIDDISAAISFALDSARRPAGAMPKLRFHKETSLLIIETRSAETLDIAQQVLSELRKANPHQG